MREILFRGKRTGNGEWVEGFYYEHEPPLVGIAPPDYVPPDNTVFIARTGFADWNMPRPAQLYQVLPETVGQFTGLVDKNNKRVFTGDIVRDQYNGGIARVEYLQQGYGYYLVFQNTDRRLGHRSRNTGYEEDCLLEVIGNIYDNPELMKE